MLSRSFWSLPQTSFPCGAVVGQVVRIFPALDGEEELELLDGKEEEGGNTGVLQTEF